MNRALAAALAVSFAAAPAAASDDVAERFVSWFQERCARPIQQGAAPDVSLLVSAGAEVIQRYPTVPDYADLEGRSLSYWVSRDDLAGEIVIVVEHTPKSERCAVVTRAFTAERFARLMKETYPDYVGQSSDEAVINARAFLEDPSGQGRSLVYSSYHDAQHGVSAGVVSMSEAE
ncbi:MAG: hypothetical protein ACE37J_21080 [Pikeienuella sp.]|uniref:hypothetical protein n=1 Tax=Pikeienuella sp. TaxID=2831957 RepID=UPI00391A34EE